MKLGFEKTDDGRYMMVHTDQRLPRRSGVLSSQYAGGGPLSESDEKFLDALAAIPGINSLDHHGPYRLGLERGEFFSWDNIERALVAAFRERYELPDGSGTVKVVAVSRGKDTEIGPVP
jgi:hypothetical protein